MKNKKVCALFAAAMTTALPIGNIPVAAAPVTKDETVYVKTGADGQTNSVTVSDQISNIGKMTAIEDISSLLGIENVKGEETFAQKGNAVTWQNDGSSKICYQGTSEEELPMGMEISYELDGKSISYEELKGKSGHIRIAVSYKNYTEGDDYVPFMMATGILIDGDSLTNIVLEHGQMVSDGERNIVIGYGIPGLQDYLKLDDQELVEDLTIPEGFAVEGDVTEFDKIICMSVATNEIFHDIDGEKPDTIDDLKSDLTDLQDASTQLVDGSGELQEGVGTLQSASGDLISGVRELAQGGKDLKAGTAALASGSRSEGEAAVLWLFVLK